MKYLSTIHQEENKKGIAVLKDEFTKKVTIITMPAGHFEKFFENSEI